MTLRLITTTDTSGQRAAELHRLLESIEANIATSAHPIHLHLLLQNHASAEPDIEFPKWCTIRTMTEGCSLSEARNRILRELQSDDVIADDDIIGFPDDDCWFPYGLLDQLATIFRHHASVGLFVCRCSLWPCAGILEASLARTARITEIVRLSSSNNVFFRGSVLKRIGFFDEKLGLGTVIGGSEDTDFAIRASFVAETSVFYDSPLVGHTAPSRETAARYFRGSLVVLARYGQRSPALALELARKLCVGFIFVASRRITVTTFAQSVWLAATQSVDALSRRAT